MKIEDILRKELIILDLQATSKIAAIEEMSTLLAEKQVISDKETFITEILKREELGSTGIGDGIAIPHAKTEVVTRPSIVFARSQIGIDYDSLDGKKAFLFFMIATPAESSDAHLKLLSQLSTQLIHQETREKLMQAKDYQSVLNIFTGVTQTASTTHQDAPFIAAVTGCATGIAHTYMAAEKLQQTAKKLGVNIKVETNGSTGVENRLTTDDIKKAIGIIIAADIQVEMARFNGKPLISQPVAAGIHKPDILINDILKQNISPYHADTQVESTKTEYFSLGRQIYKHLMSGVSHMLPFVIGGGIAIALAFLVDQILGVPQTELANLGSFHSFAALLMQVGQTAFGFMLPVFAGYIAYSIADRPGLVAGFVAGGIAAAGGAGFLGALIGGFLAGYSVILIKKLLQKLPKSLDGIKIVLFYPVFAVLIVGFTMILLNIPMRFINTSMNSFLATLQGANAIILGLLLGTMMAIDLGGPINKAAYIFSTGTLATTVTTGGSSIMAATMAAGMVPPLAIFLATLLFKNKFTKQERDAGLTNSILGASFITEGAIPFAAADPLRMIPSFIAGSAVTSALVMFLNIKVLAPHGGIFVIFLVSNPLLYIIAILIGTSISALLIAILRKKTTAQE